MKGPAAKLHPLHLLNLSFRSRRGATTESLWAESSWKTTMVTAGTMRLAKAECSELWQHDHASCSARGKVGNDPGSAIKKWFNTKSIKDTVQNQQNWALSSKTNDFFGKAPLPLLIVRQHDLDTPWCPAYVTNMQPNWANGSSGTSIYLPHFA